MDIKLMPEKYKRKGIGGGLSLFRSGPLRIIVQLASKANLWFVLSFVLLIGLVLVCFGLWGYKINLDKNKESLVQKMEELQAQRDLNLENDFMELKETIENFRKILDKRIYSSNILETLEELTIPDVQYSNFKVNFGRLLLDLKAEAADYNSLAKQVIIFKNDSRINKVNLFEVSLEKSGWVGTNLNLELNPSFLYE